MLLSPVPHNSEVKLKNFLKLRQPLLVKKSKVKLAKRLEVNS